MQDSLPAGGLRLYREGVEPSGSLRKVSGYIALLLSRISPDARIAHAKKTSTLLNQSAKEKGYITAANAVAPDKEKVLLALRFDPELSIVSAAEYGRINLDALINDGLVSDQIGDDKRLASSILRTMKDLPERNDFLKEQDFILSAT